MKKSNEIGDGYGHLMRKNRRVWLIAGAVIAVVVIIGLAAICKPKEKESLGETITVITPNTEETQSETEDTQLEGRIQTLVRRYFTALADFDLETLNNICETSEGFDEAHLQEQAAYIEGYRNIECTIMDGLVEGTYIVYAYYEMKFEYIDTLAPALSQLYIKTDGDGLPYIYQGVIDGELSAYMAELNAGNQISELAETVNKKLEAACRSDEKLDLFIRILRGEAVIELPESEEAVTDSTEAGKN